MKIKLFDSELRVMEILWKEGEVSAKKIAEILAYQIEWSKTTTYTVIKKCIEKGAIERNDPGFICHAVISREEAQDYETRELIDKMYDGKADMLIASLITEQKLTQREIEHLKKIVNDLK